MSSKAGPASRDASTLVSPADVVDVFTYVVVLNLAIQFVPQVIAETFTMSLLTAVLLKVVLEAVVWAKHHVKARFVAARTPFGKVAAGSALWAVLVGSKFVVLELVALLFRGSVVLGGFFAVTGLIITLLLCRAGVRMLLREADPLVGAAPAVPRGGGRSPS